MSTAGHINLNGLDILVVEDDAVLALILARELTRHGARVEVTRSGGEALASFMGKRFPIIVTDIIMPGMDGLELVSRVRQLDKNTQVIATSVKRDTGCLISAIELGFYDYFLKPVDIEKLLWSIRRCADSIADRIRLEDERQKFQAVVECLGEGLTIKDLDYRIIYQNKAMTDVFGDHVGSYCYSVFGEDAPCRHCPTVLAMADGSAHSSQREYQLHGKSGYLESSASLLRNAAGAVTGCVEIVRDISERIKNEQFIRDMAFHDPLTGLANRRLFEDRLEQAVAKSRRYNMRFGLFTLDLDHFKEINDTLGHEAGDKVLREAAERIKACCKRDIDTISRQGGDEFSIIFTDCGDRAQLTVIAEELLLLFSQPFRLTDTRIEMTASIGISIFPDNGTVMKELEIASDRAMYAAKKAGRNTFRFWEPYLAPYSIET